MTFEELYYYMNALKIIKSYSEFYEEEYKNVICSC